MAKILVIDDERSVRNTLKDMLEYEGYQVEVALDTKDALSKNDREDFDFILCEAKYAGSGSDDIIKALHRSRPSVPIMVTSRDRDGISAIECRKRGAVDLLEKPINLNKLLISIKNSMDSSFTPQTTDVKIAGPKPQRVRQNRSNVEPIIGESKVIMGVKKLIDKIAPSEARVLITGSNGTGKELVARWIHEKSNRRNAPFVEVNCAAIPSELIESELFGHEKGAFTSAIKQRKGKFEQADGGTIFLDEIGDMSLSAQAKVLRALQEKKVCRVGCDKDIEVNVRVVAATNKDLYEEIKRRNFREDLYHRLSVIVINVPTLNERVEDIPLLVSSFIKNICSEYGMPEKKICEEAMAELKKMNWTGNIRQLRNVVERLIILSEKSISLEDIKSYV